MISATRSDENPILVPRADVAWESAGAFNGSPVADKSGVHLLYRAQGAPQKIGDATLSISTIGCAKSKDGVHFTDRWQLIKPEAPWEQFGCEDPRVTKIDGTYYIFYTALGQYPFRAEGIKVAVAITKDLKTIKERHLVTPFNAKAMTLFPEKVNGKFAALLTINTDLPPDHICLALADKIEDYWSPDYWERWHASLPAHVVHLRRALPDHLEVGAQPVKTKQGWLVVFSYIENYAHPPATFGVHAALLDLKDPTRVVARTREPLLVPHEEYEHYGAVPNIVFPSGALIEGRTLSIYYGAADTTTALAHVPLPKLLDELMQTRHDVVQLVRYPENPIMQPISTHAWEAKAVFNPAAIYLNNKVHLLYRAVSPDNTSVFGYAVSDDGFTITERLSEPVYVPRAPFEQKLVAGGNSGCEDPRLTQIGDRIYMCYTAFDGIHPPHVALTSISESDFLARKWQWSDPVIISPLEADDKDTAVFPKKIDGKYVFLHRLGQSIWIDFVERIDGPWEHPLDGKVLMGPRSGERDSQKIGIAGPPIETEYGWLLIYHGIARSGDHPYRLRAALLDLNDPTKVLVRTKDPILDVVTPYERYGIVPNVVFSNGAVVVDNRLIVYYGGADTVIGVASVQLSELLYKLMKEKEGL